MSKGNEASGVRKGKENRHIILQVQCSKDEC